MKIKLSEQRTHEGFTYLAGEHEVSESVGAALLANFPLVCSVVSDTHAPKTEESDEAPVSVPETENVEETHSRKRKK